MNNPLVAILGCGPAGLLSAWACERSRVPFAIFSNPVKSVLGGAQFSHIAIPEISDEVEAVSLTYRVDGESNVYQQKVYGSSDVPFVSIDNVYDRQQVSAWNLRAIYDWLWDRFSPRIVPQEVGPSWVEKALQGGTFDLVFSSVPATAVCRATIDSGILHTFRSHPIRIYEQCLDESLPDNTIWYDGTKDHSWYRMSRIFGVGGTEWGGMSPTPPGISMRVVSKPISTNCDCYPSLQRIGRYGTWQKGILTMHAFNKTIDTLAIAGVDL